MGLCRLSWEDGDTCQLSKIQTHTVKLMYVEVWGVFVRLFVFVVVACFCCLVGFIRLFFSVLDFFAYPYLRFYRIYEPSLS